MASFFIRRPIVAIVIAILTVIVGAIAIALLPIAQFPNIAPPEIWLQANYPGADAKTLEAVCRYANRTASHRRRQYGIHVFRKHHQWFANISARRF